MGKQEAPAGDVKTGQLPLPGELPDPLGLGPLVEGRKREYPVGTRRLTAAGYITVKYGAGGTVLWENEARLVVEQRLGRRLEPGEEVRHRDGVPRWDNRLEGLELWRNGRPARLPRKAPAKRTNWKKLHLEAIASLYRVFPAGAVAGGVLNEDQAAALEQLLLRQD